MPAGGTLPGARQPGTLTPAPRRTAAPAPAAKPPVPPPPKPKEPAPAPMTDYERYALEYQAAGAFKFYENTESRLRMAQFEEALMRYCCLKGWIQGRADYHGLLASVNRRIKFLQKQLHLRDSEVCAIAPRKPRLKKLKPAVKQQEAKLPETLPGGAKPQPSVAAGPVVEKPIGPVTATPSPPAAVAPPAPVPTATAPPPAPVPVVTAPPAEQKQPPVVTTDTKPKEEEKAAEEKEKEEKPPVPLTFWQRLKTKLHLGKKPSSSDDKKSDSATAE